MGDNIRTLANLVETRMTCSFPSRLTSDPKIAVVGQVGRAPGLLLDQDPHLADLEAVIICANLALKYGKWGII